MIKNASRCRVSRLAGIRSGCWALVFVVLLCIPAELRAEDSGHLSTEEVVGITAGSLGLVGSAYLFKHALIDTRPRWVDPPGIDLWFTRTFGADPRPYPRNFMDTDRAAFINILCAGTTIGILNAMEPRFDRPKDIWQSQFLYYTGALTQKGVTDFFKAGVARVRPLSRLVPEVAAQRTKIDYARDKESFFSGHASSAFYSMTFLNHHVRDFMHRRFTASEFDTWNWVSPTVTFTWATVIAFSRVHAYQHYFTDILAGAVVGWAIGELFYAIDDDVRGTGSRSATSFPIMISVRF